MTDHHDSHNPDSIQINLNHLFSLDMVLVAVVSLDGLLLKANRAWDTILGYPVDQLLDQPFIHLDPSG